MNKSVQFLIAALIILSFILQGCATIFGGSKSKTHVRNGTPPGAMVYYNGSYVDNAPAKVKVPRSNKPGNSKIEIRKEGYETSTINMTRKVSVGFTILDVLAGVVWLGIDFATGNIYQPRPNKIDYRLTPLSDYKPGEKYNLKKGDKVLFTKDKYRNKEGVIVALYPNQALIKFKREPNLIEKASGIQEEIEEQIEVPVADIANMEEQSSGQQQNNASIPAETTNIGLSDVDKDIPVSRVNKKNTYALIIGNEDYSSYQRGLNSETDVDYAVNDATVFKKYATNTLGINEDNIYFLTDATAATMARYIELVSKIVSKIPGSELVFYYAGHGFPDENEKIPYLIPVDVNATNLSSAIKLSEVYKQFSETGAEKVTVFLDACFSGGGRKEGLLAARSVKIKPKETAISGNMIIYTASSGEQSSLPYKEKQHGMFTYYLLKKLQSTEGNVTHGELAGYLKQKVSVSSLRVNEKEQDPTVNVSDDIKDTWENWKFR
ncbi:MAG: caspase family protein [Bacteroidota bacterium]